MRRFRDLTEEERNRLIYEILDRLNAVAYATPFIFDKIERKVEIPFEELSELLKPYAGKEVKREVVKEALYPIAGKYGLGVSQITSKLIRLGLLKRIKTSRYFVPNLWRLDKRRFKLLTGYDVIEIKETIQEPDYFNIVRFTIEIYEYLMEKLEDESKKQESIATP